MWRDQYEAELINIARTAAQDSYPRAHAKVLRLVTPTSPGPGRSPC